ncbi:hypothetical protein T310_3265 [Rasamsonia emersonii CBS 393.64]|uniref:Protein kinase domain-containing protein n=1 Tax=Rasamsonia emersonii (strain ATCC 16479 / CBS 393.64 / IMI 116815) TaxID=1408163 RepID=A0A0F4YWQ5_RASE3|nr:hypothetical protein T310_3265 [Rasamsonia emersonii CBS 393.64]KKA22722.1 hypothetical protein T310_3265 [Rasamsonia emersonii CBS 393.64]
MAASTGRTWRRLLDEKKAAFSRQGWQLPPAIANEESFRNHFEALCRSCKERYYTRLLVQLHYGSINAFACAVDGALEHVPPSNLAGLVSGGCFVAIKCACEAGVPPVRIVELLGQLNSAVPSLGADIPLFPHDPDVQAPLQDIFDAYMDSLLCILTSFNLDHTPPYNFDPLQSIQAKIQKSAETFAMGRAKFEEMLELAERKEARGSNFSRSFPNHRWDIRHQHPYDTQARFIPQRRLGRGSFGDVDEVQEVSTGAVYARKIIQLPGDDVAAATRVEEVRNEVRVMQRLTHQHIATVLFWLKDQGACSIFMNPVGDCDLRVYLENCTRDRNPAGALQNILPWFGCLLDALSFAHRLHVTHRDIKPSNILIKENQVYLADFGLAKDFTQYGTSKTSNFFVCGTPVYRAPEVRPDNPRGRQADVFSLGCVFSEMLTVCCGRSLDDFQNFRRAPENECGALAFRENLPNVQEWLNQLKKDSDDFLCETLVWQIMLMIKSNPDARPTAQKGVDFLMSSNQREAFFCQFHF